MIADFFRWLTAEFTGSLSQRTNKTALHPDTKITTQNHEFGLYVYPADGHTISLSGEWLQTKLSNEVREDFFGDFMYRFNFSEKEIDVEFYVIIFFANDMFRDCLVVDVTST